MKIQAVLRGLCRLIMVGILFCAFAPAVSQSAEDRFPSIEDFMKIGYASSPIMSPDGEDIYFSASFISPRQLYRISRKIPYPYLMTYRNQPVLYPSMSPDGSKIVFLNDDGGNEQYQLFLLDTVTGRIRRLTDNPKARYGQAMWTPDGSEIYFRANLENATDFNVYSMNLSTGKTKLVIDGPGYMGPSGISPDGRRLAYYLYMANDDVELLTADLKTGARRLMTPQNSRTINNFVGFSADGKIIYFITDNNAKGALKLAAMDAETGHFKVIFDRDSFFEVDSAVMSPCRRYMAVVVNRDGYGVLSLIDLQNKSELPVPSLNGIVSDVSFSNVGTVGFTFSSPARSSEVYTWDWKSRKLSQITYSSYLGIDPSTFVEPELIRYGSFDGLEIPAFVYLPKGWEKNKGNIPFIIDFHGGPEGQSRPYFQRHFNYLLSRGFGIMTPNIRGSIGYGNHFKSLDNYRLRYNSVKDGYYAARYLIEKGYTKEGLIGIKGGSYGGFMVMALITEYPKMFGAAYESVGIVDFENFLQNTVSYRRHLREAEYGPLTDREFLRSISPIHRLDRVVTPLMVSHGKNDPRVPVSEAHLIINNLEKRGVSVKVLIFEDEGHGVSKLENRLVLYREMADFFKKHLK